MIWIILGIVTLLILNFLAMLYMVKHGWCFFEWKFPFNYIYQGMVYAALPFIIVYEKIDRSRWLARWKGWRAKAKLDRLKKDQRKANQEMCRRCGINPNDPPPHIK